MQKSTRDWLSGIKNSTAHWLPWWYTTIAAGFTLLALAHLIQGDKAWLIGIRLILAAGFGVLALIEFKAKSRKR